MKKAIIVVAVLAVIAVLFGIFLPWPFLLMWGFVHFDGEQRLALIEKLGQYGDAFGVLTALFTVLAFGILCWTLRLQRKELQLQRGELSLQRGEMSMTRGVFEIQLFESTLFHLLELYQGVISRIYYSRKNRDFHGVLAIIVHAEEAGLHKVRDLDECINLCSRKMGVFYNPYYPFLNLVDFVENYRPAKLDRVRYAKIIRAQLSEIEIVLLCTYCKAIADENMRVFISNYIFFDEERPMRKFPMLDKELRDYFCLGDK